jgi:hypothetical protein
MRHKYNYDIIQCVLSLHSRNEDNKKIGVRVGLKTSQIRYIIKKYKGVELKNEIKANGVDVQREEFKRDYPKLIALWVRPNQCRWIENNSYCQKIKKKGSSFCEYHHSIAYVPIRRFKND